ncbi:MAG TPA: hypothetical protein VG206_17525 [Terriglobia bacterium]|nr:hypothetical protein [Terriglobia bacterium]
MNEQDEARIDERKAQRPDTASAPMPRGPHGGFIILVVLLAFAVVASLDYTFSARKEAQDLAAKQAQTSAALQESVAALAALKAKVEAMSVPVAPQAPAPQATPAQTRTTSAATGSHAHRRPRAVADPRWAKVQKRLDDQQMELDSTEKDLQTARQELSGNLQSTRDDLNGSIARTHDDLVALEKKGERDYHEFDLTRSKAFERVGPVRLELKKTNTKHDFYDVAMMVDDYRLDKKHVNLYEPVLIYPEDSRQPLELVVNQISRDEIHGYVSQPKDQGTRGTHNPASGTAGAASSSITPDSGSAPGASGGQTDSAPATPNL